MNRTERDARDLMIAAEFHTGRRQAEIAARHEISDRTVRRAIKRVAARTGNQLGLLELRDWSVKRDVAIEELGLVRIGSRDPRSRIAAIRLQLQLMRDRCETLIRLGALPNENDESGQF